MGNKFTNINRYQRKSKYGAKKITYEGNRFDSLYECNVFKLLRSRQLSGELQNLQRQITVKFFNGISARDNISVRVDFSFEEGGRTIYAEAKGFETPEWKIKKKLWKILVKKELRIYQGGGNNPKLKEVLCSEQGDV